MSDSLKDNAKPNSRLFRHKRFSANEQQSTKLLSMQDSGDELDEEALKEQRILRAKN